MTIAEFITSVETRRKTLTVHNEDEPESLVRMLKRMVDSPDVEVREGDLDEPGPANVVVLEDEDGTELGVSTIGDLGDSVLMVNSDLYVTGTRSIDEVNTPAVLVNLDQTFFDVAGKQKMLLIEISRHIESLAWETGTGTLQTGFQYLSRVDDERGTRRVYDRLSASDVDVHVYGHPDRVPNLDEDVTVHGEASAELRRSWFVVHTDCPDGRKAALVAEETGPNEWHGYWSFDPDHADAVADYLFEQYSP